MAPCFSRSLASRLRLPGAARRTPQHQRAFAAAAADLKPTLVHQHHVENKGKLVDFALRGQTKGSHNYGENGHRYGWS